MFYYFSKMAPTGYSLTVTMDVTKLRETVKAAGMKLFPAYLWLVTRCLNEQPEFKCAIKDGQLGYSDDGWHVQRFLERLQAEMDGFSI